MFLALVGLFRQTVALDGRQFEAGGGDVGKMLARWVMVRVGAVGQGDVYAGALHAHTCDFLSYLPYRL